MISSPVISMTVSTPKFSFTIDLVVLQRMLHLSSFNIVYYTSWALNSSSVEHSLICVLTLLFAHGGQVIEEYVSIS